MLFRSGVPVFLYIDDPEFDLKKYKVSVGFSCRVIANIENDVKRRDYSTFVGCSV